jgi:hypothetical protein
MIKRPTRPILFGALAFITLAVGGIAVFSKPSPAAPVTVYLTPT